MQPEEHDLKKRIYARYGQLVQDREGVASQYREVQKYVRPFIGTNLSGLNSGEETDGYTGRMDSILDNTADRAADDATAGLLDATASAGKPWFRLGVPDYNTEEDPEAAAWLYGVEEDMRHIFSRSNVYQALYRMTDEIMAGTAALELIEDYDTLFRVRAYTLGEYYLATDNTGKVDTFYRDLHLTSKQMIEEFGEENVSESVKNSFKNGGTETKWHVIQAVEPNTGIAEYPRLKDFPFRSVYLEAATCKKGSTDTQVLHMQGLKEFRFLTPRWYTNGNRVYGVGPYLRVLPDTKELQAWRSILLETGEKITDPPMRVPGQPNDLQVNSMKGGLTYDTSVSPGSNAGITPLYQVNGDLNATFAIIGDLREQIREGLHSNLFMMLAQLPDKAGRTATEIAERSSEKLRRLGPMAQNLHSEAFTPLIEIAFSMMVDAGLVAPPPESLAGRPLRVVYISSLAQALQLSGLAGVEQFFAFVGNISAVKPEVLDTIDGDEAVRFYASRTNVPPGIMITDNDVAFTRQARAQQQQLEQAGVASQNMAQTAKILSDTPITEGSALNALLGSQPQAGR